MFNERTLEEYLQGTFTPKSSLIPPKFFQKLLHLVDFSMKLRSTEAKEADAATKKNQLVLEEVLKSE
jgi:hypothetical protein